MVFAALALHRDAPGQRAALAADPAARDRFAQEVRRLTPFMPAVVGKVLEPFAWRGHRLRRGDWVVLDTYGTNRDPRRWPDPDRFDPDRFLARPRPLRPGPLPGPRRAGSAWCRRAAADT